MTADVSSSAVTSARLVTAALLDQPDVVEAFAAERDTPALGRRLAAYLVPAPGRGVNLVATHRCLATIVARTSLPASYVTLTALPRTAVGGVDAHTLADSDPEYWLDAYAPPATDTEQRLVEIWREVLEIDQVGREDDFFDLGGYSILIPLLVANVHDAFGVEMSIMDGFERSALFDLAAHIDALRPGAS